MSAIFLFQESGLKAVQAYALALGKINAVLLDAKISQPPWWDYLPQIKTGSEIYIETVGNLPQVIQLFQPYIDVYGWKIFTFPVLEKIVPSKELSPLTFASQFPDVIKGLIYEAAKPWAELIAQWEMDHLIPRTMQIGSNMVFFNISSIRIERFSVDGTPLPSLESENYFYNFKVGTYLFREFAGDRGQRQLVATSLIDQKVIREWTYPQDFSSLEQADGTKAFRMAYNGDQIQIFDTQYAEPSVIKVPTSSDKWIRFYKGRYYIMAQHFEVREIPIEERKMDEEGEEIDTYVRVSIIHVYSVNSTGGDYQLIMSYQGSETNFFIIDDQIHMVGESQVQVYSLDGKPIDAWGSGPGFIMASAIQNSQESENPKSDVTLVALLRETTNPLYQPYKVTDVPRTIKTVYIYQFG